MRKDSFILVFKRYPSFSALFLYFLGSAFLTWPLIFRIDSVIFGDYGDARGIVWQVWGKVNDLLDAPATSLIAAPFGISTNPGFRQPFIEGLLNILAKYSNEITAYNLSIFLAFPLTAIATYFLLNKLLNNQTAAFVGGLVFGFSPASVMQAGGGHPSLSFNLFIPLFLLALFNNRNRRTFISAAYVAISFALLPFTAMYFGYFAIYIGIFFVAFDLLSRQNETVSKILLSYFFAATLATALILPFVYQIIYQQITWSGDAPARAWRDFRELGIYSSRPWEYFIPSIDHPVLGDFIYDFTRAHLHGSNISEQTLYLGLIPIGLLLTGTVLAVRKKFEVTHRIYFLFFALGALWMYFLSLPPLLSIGSVSVPTVSYFAYFVAPMFRVYARFGILVNFFVACAASVVLAHLYQHMRRARYFAMLALSLTVLIFEYWSVPPNHTLAVDKPPEVYQWLEREAGDIIIAEYPMMPWDNSSFYSYPFWQRIHKKRLVNGASPDNSLAWRFFERVNDLDNPATPTLLKAIGVKYVIVHTSMYREGPIPEPIKRYFPASVSSSTYNSGNLPVIPFPLKLIKTFGTDLVFSLEDVPFEPATTEIFLPVNRAR